MRVVFKRNGPEFDRGLGFLDAVYGFAITLLVANIDLPPAEAWRDPALLFDYGLGTQLIGFLISFAVIALFWYYNATLLSRFRALDGPVIVANLVATGFIVLLPFTTQAISDPGISEYPFPTALYALNLAFVMLSQTATRELGRARGLIAHDIPRGAWWAERVDVGAQIVVFLVSIPIAYLAGPTWAQLSWALVLVVGRITGKWSSRVAKRHETEHAA